MVAVIKLSITTPNIVPILLSQLTVQRLSNITQEMIHEKNKLIINPETAAKKLIQRIRPEQYSSPLRIVPRGF